MRRRVFWAGVGALAAWVVASAAGLAVPMTLEPAS